MRVVWVLTPLLMAVFAGCMAGEGAPDPGLSEPEASSTWTGATRASPFVSFEPTLGVTSDGSVFLSTFSGGIGTHRSAARSTDGGLTWTDVSPQVAGTIARFPAQSNDPYVHVDPDTDRIFLSDLQALMCSTLAYSDDGGDSWVLNPVGCGHPAGVHDHQTVFTSAPRTLTPTGLYPNLVHYCVNRVVDTACASSLDGGLSFGPLVTAGIGCGLTGHGTSDPDGRIFIAKGCGSSPTLLRSGSDGLAWSSSRISWSRADTHDVNLAFDDAGNGFAFWRSNGRAVLAVSSDHGVSWTDLGDVAPSAVSLTEFHTIAAGGPGVAAMVYYGTESGATDRRQLGSADPWNLYMTIVQNATGSPTFTTVMLNDPADPVARGTCDDDGRCGGVGDFIDVVIDAEGRPWASFVDVCVGRCTEPDATFKSGRFGSIGTLETGPRLRGSGDLPPLV